MAMGTGDAGGRCDDKVPNTLFYQKPLLQGYCPLSTLPHSLLAVLSSGDLTTFCQLLNLPERQGILKRAFDHSRSLITMDEYANETSTLSSILLLPGPA